MSTISNQSLLLVRVFISQNSCFLPDKSTKSKEFDQWPDDLSFLLSHFHENETSLNAKMHSCREVLVPLIASMKKSFNKKGTICK